MWESAVEKYPIDRGLINERGIERVRGERFQVYFPFSIPSLKSFLFLCLLIKARCPFRS